MAEQYIVGQDPSEIGKDTYQEWAQAFNSYDKAEVYAKKSASKKQVNFTIYKSFATAKAVVPQIEVVKH